MADNAQATPAPPQNVSRGDYLVVLRKRPCLRRTRDCARPLRTPLAEAMRLTLCR